MTTHPNLTLTGELPDGTLVLVQLHDPDGQLAATTQPVTGEVAFRDDPGPWGRWGRPTAITEQRIQP